MSIGRLMAWVLVAVMPVWFGSCKKDNAGGGDIVTPTTIEGSWKISGMKGTSAKSTVDLFDLIIMVGGKEAITCLTETKIAFNGNGNVTGTPSPACQSGDIGEYTPVMDKASWKVSGNKVSITDSDGTETYDLTVNGNTMSWSNKQQGDVDGDGVEDTYTQTIEFKRV